MTELERVTQNMSERQRAYLRALLGKPELGAKRTYYSFYCEQLWVVRETGRANSDLGRALRHLEQVISPQGIRFLRSVAEARRV